MNTQRHLMLWGIQQVGKTTLINQLLSGHPGWTVKGFRTYTDFGAISGAIGPVYIAPVHPCGWYRRDEAVIGIRKQGQRSSYPAVFDRVGVRILQETQGADLLVMDEIGTMENDALAFQRAVLQSISASTPIIGVMKGQSSPFMDAVRNHPSVKTLEITLANRGKMLSLIDEFVSGSVIRLKAPSSSAESAPRPHPHR